MECYFHHFIIIHQPAFVYISVKFLALSASTVFFSQYQNLDAITLITNLGSAIMRIFISKK